MSLEHSQKDSSLTNEELLIRAERFALWAERNYGRADRGNEYAQAAAAISQALGALVIARVLNAQERGQTSNSAPELQTQEAPSNLLIPAEEDV